MHTLPDYLKTDLDILFVGINPGCYSVRVSHYFATPTNRFWRALNQSGLIPNLDSELGPEDDAKIGKYGVGFTDVVKWSSSSASKLRACHFREWVPVLNRKILEFSPQIACFQGILGYRNYLWYAEGSKEEVSLGLQKRKIGSSRIFLVPNPSAANATFSLNDLVFWLKQLAALRDQLVEGII